MSLFELRLQPSVEKDLRRLSHETIDRVFARLESLRSEPFPPQAVKLVGTEGLYRIRVGDYRIIYDVDLEAASITIYYIRHRRDVYRSL